MLATKTCSYLPTARHWKPRQLMEL